ncbi:MAG: HIT family protein [Bryobacteraceae bacterium]
MNCIFCDIITGNIPAHIVLEDDISLAFLDNRPLFPGHCLLVPKEHCDVLADLPAGMVGPLFQNVQLLSRAMEAGLGAEGSFVAVNNRISQSVPHLHVHVVPRRKKDGLKGFFWPRSPYKNNEAAADVQHQLKSVINALRENT